MEINQIDIAYIAGLFDGEGSVGFYWVKGKYKTNKNYGKLMVKISQDDRRPLDWIKKILNYGSVQPYTRPSGTTNHNYVVAHENARIFLDMVYPYLKVKKEVTDEKLELDRKYCARRKHVCI